MTQDAIRPLWMIPSGILLLGLGLKLRENSADPLLLVLLIAGGLVSLRSVFASRVSVRFNGLRADVTLRDLSADQFAALSSLLTSAPALFGPSPLGSDANSRTDVQRFPKAGSGVAPQRNPPTPRQPSPRPREERRADELRADELRADERQPRRSPAQLPPRRVGIPVSSIVGLSGDKPWMRVAAPYPQRSAEIFIADCIRALERAQLASGEDAQALAHIAWSSHVACIRQFVASVLSKLREVSDRRFFESTLLLHPLQGVLCGVPEFTGSELSLLFEPFGWEFLGQEPQNWPEQELDDYRDYLVDVRGRVLGSEDAAPLQDTRIDQVLFPGFKHCGQVVLWPTLRYSEAHFQDPRSIPAEASFPTNPEVASATPQVQWWSPTRSPRNQLLETFLHALEKSGVGTARDRRTVELAKVFQKHLHETASAVLTGLESVSQSRLEFYAAIAYPLKTILTDIGLNPYGWEYCNGPTTDFIRDAGTVDVMHKIRGEGPDIDTRVAGVLYPGFALDDELSRKRLSVHLPTLLSQRMQGR